MVKVVVVNGAPGCGKTTFENICDKYINDLPIGYFEYGKYSYTLILSTIDFVKKIAKECGWNGEKSLKNRKFLSDLKDLLTDWGDVPFKDIKKHIDRECQLGLNTIVFVDCREPQEIQKLKDYFNATTVLIRRPGDTDTQTSNHADSEVFNYNYDLTIWNNSDIIGLEKKAKEFIEYLKKEEVPHYVNVN